MNCRLAIRTSILFALWAGLVLPAAGQPKGDTRALTVAVEKMNGYTRTDKEDPARPLLTVQFRYPGPKDGDLKQLRPALQDSPVPVGLNLNQCRDVTDAGVAHLEGLTTLRSLGLGDTKVTDAGLAHVKGMTGLESLYLSGDQITDAGLAQLAKLTNLRKLSVYSKNVTDAGYKHLAGLTNLEEIRVGSNQEVGDAALEHMKEMTKLKKLDVGKDKLTDAGLAHVRNFTELRELRVEGPKVTAAGFKNLAPLTKLKKLTLMSCPGINGEAMAALSGMTDLEELELIYCGAIKPEAAAHLKGLTGLKKLRFESVTDEALAGIAGLPKLEDLQLFYTSVGDAGLKHLAGLKTLKTLNLMNTRVTDAGLEHLAGLTAIKSLNLGKTQVKGEGLKHLAGLPELTNLSLFETPLTDAGLKHLAGLTGLRELGISGTAVTDAGVAQLKGLTGLTGLDLTGTKVTLDGAVELKKALPKARIRDFAGDDVTLNKAPDRPKPPAEDLSKAKPDFTLTAEEFFKEYKADKSAAERKYKGKVIELSGTVSGMGRNISEDGYLTLEVPKELIGVQCFTADDAPWNTAIPGQKVKVKGKWPEFSISAALIHCVITEAGPSPAMRLTADQLAKEYKADPEAARKKYADKWLIVTGEVVDREFNSVGAASVQLKTTGDVKVKCSFTAFDKAQVKQFKVGQSVTLVGQFTLNFGDAEVGLYFCQALKK